jgi:hypothetical protein
MSGVRDQVNGTNAAPAPAEKTEHCSRRPPETAADGQRRARTDVIDRETKARLQQRLHAFGCQSLSVDWWRQQADENEIAGISGQAW